MSAYMLRTTLILLSVLVTISLGAISREKRQTYQYPEELLRYAHPHPGTKIQQGYLARYAPQDWPKWYSRNMMQWNGLSVMSPYDKNDVRHSAWVADYVRRSKE